MAQKDYFQICI